MWKDRFIFYKNVFMIGIIMILGETDKHSVISNKMIFFPPIHFTFTSPFHKTST